MIYLTGKDAEEFEKKIEEGLKHPTGPIPTPKLKEAIKLIKKLAKKKKEGLNK